MKRILIAAIAALSLVGCNRNAVQKVPALDLANLDTTVTPGEDFYQYATGGWQKNNPLKPEYSSFGSFNILRELNVERLNDLFKSMAEMKPAKGSVEQKIADLYKLGIDSVRRNEEGLQPIMKYLERVYAIKDKSEIPALLAEYHVLGVSGFYDIGVETDLADSDSQILYVSNASLGIGDRDYYLDPENAEILKGYRDYLIKLFTISGREDAEKAADNMISVEMMLAKTSWTKEQRRDYNNLYNVMSSDDLIALCPALDFKTYFELRGVPAQEKLVVLNPKQFAAISEFFANADLEVLKDYIAGNVISDSAEYLSDDLYDAYFEFYDRQLNGTQEKKPLWKRVMEIPNNILGEAVGKMYVAKYFPESSKAKMLDIVNNLKTALGEHLDSLDWMGDATKAKAHEKLASFTVKIGYPDKWKDYSTLEIDPEKSYLENISEANKWFVADNMSKLGKPVDRDEWLMTPQTVNAYYNPTTNEICFPAAILQPPFFNPDADAPVNYGAIGVVIGHEMSHGFDDQGRMFDAKGNMVNWWTDEDDVKFREKAAILGAQYDAVEIVPGVFANGSYTMGENIGDHGGISIAWTAMQNYLKSHPQKPIDGFTPEQRFWLSYGLIWAANSTDEAKVRLTYQDVHSLPRNRVNVAIRNFEEFFKAFDIKEGDKMYRPESERVHIW
ncbi:MAG: M13 family metallopeptidase [Bacteroidota bacterium]|nr:M13 family metallopeptidase [Bacteroidota bacterium]